MEKSKTCWLRRLILEVMWRKNLIQKKKKNFPMLPRLQLAVPGDSKRPTPSISSLICLRYSLPFVMLAFSK